MASIPPKQQTTPDNHRPNRPSLPSTNPRFHRLTDGRLPFLHRFVHDHVKTFFASLEEDTSTHSRHLLNIARHIEQALIKEWSLESYTFWCPELQDPMQRLAVLFTKELSVEHLQVFQGVLNDEVHPMDAAVSLRIVYLNTTYT